MSRSRALNCDGVMETCLAGLGVDVALTEELLDHSHIVLFLHSRESSQHDGRVARLVLLIHRAHTCGQIHFTTLCLGIEMEQLSLKTT